MDDTGPQDIAEADENALTPLHPNHVKLLRTQAAIAAVPLAIGALALEFATELPIGVIISPVLLLAAWLVIRVPLRRHAARGFSLGADRLRVVRGLWFRSDTVVPFGRVQHIDLAQSALERAYGLATITVHTAGTHNASVSLPGLAQADAAAMRETIARHIRRETA